MDEQRRAERFQISFFLKIFNRDSNEAMGHLLDISVSGMRVLSDRPVDKGTEYSLYIDLRSMKNFGCEVKLNALCVWTNEDPDSGAFNCGFQFQNISQNEVDIIQKIIEQFGK